MAESAISSVSITLAKIVIKEIIFLRGVPDRVESIKKELKAMEGFLRDADLRHSKGDRGAAILVQEIKDVAYEIENVVEKINWMQRWRAQKRRFQGLISWYEYFGILREEGKKIEKIQKKISEIFQRKDKYDPTKLGETSVGKNEIDLSTEDYLNMQRYVSPDIECNSDVIGFDNEIEKIIDELIDSSTKDLTFVSLVGMGGIGKSTLASKVFTDPKIQENFNTFAWISVSKICNPVELLKDIMKQTMNIKKENSRNEGINENEIGEQELENMPKKQVRIEINKFLKNKKYLIVLDDVWEEKTLDQISHGNTIFTNSNSGSRIILTTRYLHVAKHSNCINHIHRLKLLDTEISWEFLRKKAFRLSNRVNESILNELESHGKQIAMKCNGLPLALSVLGGFLSKNMDPNIWSKMATTNIYWNEIKSEKNIVEIVALSFYDLPHYLKPCFLYMAYFPEDYFISASKLTKMWIAEGFIPYYRCSQEETARKYLTELARRSMVQVVEMSKTHGYIKKIRMHDILREFCIAESTKNGFLKICNNQQDFEASKSHGTITYKIVLNTFSKKEVGMDMPNLRTLIGFDLTELSFSRLNYLRVLELVRISNIKILPAEIGEMIFLRYIGLRKCGTVDIPSSIEKLINLQTFDARDTPINSFPNSLWTIPTLKHIYMYFLDHALMIFPKHGQLQNVQTLHLSLTYEISILETSEFINTLQGKSEIFSLCLVRILSPLKALVVFSSHKNLLELELSGRFDQGRSIHELPTHELPNNTLFPPNLRKLNLSWIELTEDPMPTLELLPSLVVLKLGISTYSGKTMSCSADGFGHLQHISIEWFVRLVEWKIEVGAMPRLSKLSLTRCLELKMQPEELVHLPALKELELIKMPNFPIETCKILEEKRCKVIIKKQLANHCRLI